MKKTSWILVAVVALGAWYVLRRPDGETTDGGSGQDIFYGRVWVDHLPATRTEMFRVLGTSRHDKFGWIAERSGWKGFWEIFTYEARGDGKLELRFPQSGQSSRIGYRAWRCTDKKEYDYCLELQGVRGPTRYYSRRGWERHGTDELRALETELAAVPE